MSDTAERLTRLLVSPRSGVAAKLDVREHDYLAFGLCRANAYPARMRGRGGYALLPTCGGIAAGRADASVAALMEMVERYCGYFGVEQRAHVGPARDDAYLWGSGLGVFGDWQFDDERFVFAKHEAQSQVRWLPGRSLADGRRRYIPAAWVQVPFFPSGRCEQLAASTSSGMAAAFDYDLAIVNGMLELLERDALMVMWHHKIGMPALRVDLAELVGDKVAANARLTGVELKFINLTNDLQVPVALCAMKRLWRGKVVHAIGLAARADLRLACRKAFYEATTESCRQIGELQSAAEPWAPAADFSNVNEVWQHGTLYSHPAYLAELDFIWNAPDEQALDATASLPPQPPQLLRALRDMLKRNALEAVVVPLSTPEVREAGIKVVKVVMPQLASFYSDHRYPCLGAERIWSAAEKLGASTDAARRVVPNALPHPFA